MERPLSAGREGMPEKGLVPLMEREEGNDAEDNALSGHHRVRMPASKRDEPVSKGGSGFGIAIGAYCQSFSSSPVHKQRSLESSDCPVEETKRARAIDRE
jgi:hypothetical protein